MNKEQSIFLDLLRFVAAMVVFLSHASGQSITGGFLWQLADFAQTAVMLFFVLSGHVIGYITDTKEKTLSDYLSARTARLYSVILPAIMITYLANLVGNTYIPGSYEGTWVEADNSDHIRYLLTALLIQNVWYHDLVPPNNGPFWSLTYELFFYLLFAAIYFLTGIKRLISIIILSLVCGPGIITYFPLWLLGYLSYHLSKKSNKHSNKHILALISAACLIIVIMFSPAYRNLTTFSEWDWGRASVIGDYIDGVLFSVHLTTLPCLATLFSKLLRTAAPLITWFGGLTFTLYLFHLPILRLFSGLSPIDSPADWLHIIIVIGGTFSIIMIVGPQCERLKVPLRKILNGTFGTNTSQNKKLRD